MILNNQEKSQIRHITQSQSWQTIERVADLLIKKIRDNSPIKETDQDTLKEVYLQEGKKRGIRDFMQELINLSQ